ncbi:MAG: Crp/Fnr family transcriptional regulator [Microscillaceae bacterium]
MPLDALEWEALAGQVYTRQIPKKGYFTQIGEIEREIGLVLRGSFRQYYIKEGDEKTTYFFFEQMFITAYLSGLTGQKSELAIQALEDSEVLCFTYAHWNQLSQQFMNYQKIARSLAEYAVMGLEVRLVELLTLSPEERYLRLLASNKKRILERIPQHYIASYLGVSAVSLSRIRQRIMQSPD